jgi:molybdopterin-guanine dinucleotide biosynthesis protein A
MKLLAAIQAGGQSRRMGTDKAWLAIHGQPMIERVLAAAQPVAQRLAIVISQTTPAPERYAALAARWQAALLIDLHDRRGPLGGIETALRACAAQESALILACDMPFLTTDFLRLLIAHHSTPDISQLTVATDHGGRPQMLCGIYGRSCLPCVEQMLADEVLRVDRLCAQVTTQQLAWADYAHLPEAERLLMNCNTKADLPDQLGFVGMSEIHQLIKPIKSSPATVITNIT